MLEKSVLTISKVEQGRWVREHSTFRTRDEAMAHGRTLIDIDPLVRMIEVETTVSHDDGRTSHLHYRETSWQAL